MEKILVAMKWIFNPKMVSGAIAGILILPAAERLLRIAQGFYPNDDTDFVLTMFLLLGVGILIWIAKAHEYYETKQAHAQLIIRTQQRDSYRIGNAYQRSKNYADAISEYEKVIALDRLVGAEAIFEYEKFLPPDKEKALLVSQMMYTPIVNDARERISEIKNRNKPE